MCFWQDTAQPNSNTNTPLLSVGPKYNLRRCLINRCHFFCIFPNLSGLSYYSVSENVLVFLHMFLFVCASVHVCMCVGSTLTTSVIHTPAGLNCKLIRETGVNPSPTWQYESLVTDTHGHVVRRLLFHWGSYLISLLGLGCEPIARRERGDASMPAYTHTHTQTHINRHTYMYRGGLPSW